MTETIPVYAQDRIARTELKNKITKMYGVTASELFLSGTQAIYMILDGLAFQFPTGTFWIDSSIYYGTKTEIVPDLERRHPGITWKWIPEGSSDLIEGDVIFLETCSNPMGLIPAYSIQAKYVVIDNTWLGPTVFNPFLHPTWIPGMETASQIVVDSCTKYMSNGQCMLGSVCFKNSNDPAFTELSLQVTFQGIQIPPTSCRTVLSQIKTLSNRINRSWKRTVTALEFLRLQPKVDQIFHPMIHSIERTLEWDGGPSVIAFHILTSANQSEMNRAVVTAGLLLKTSFGHPEDSIDPTMIPTENGWYVRLAVGTDASKIKSKLERFLKLGGC